MIHTRTICRDRWRCRIMRSDKGNVMIPYDLLADLCRYHLAGVADPEIEGRIRAGLQAKMDSTAARERYARTLPPKPTDIP